MTVTLVTVPDVPIVSTGTYQLASGETTFSQENLAAAVQAAQDATVPAPRLKLGHTDPRFEQALASGELDGEPAFGTVQNLRLSDDHQTIVGDYCDVPDWLADSLPSSYPGRSIEGGFNYTAASGRKYDLVITAAALLGTTWPGVTSLPDLREILERNGRVTEPIAAGEGPQEAVTPFVARISRPGDDAPTQVVAGVDLGSVRTHFCDALDDGQIAALDGVTSPHTAWWPRSVRAEDDGSWCVIADDDAGHLIRVPFAMQDGALSYGNPQMVVEQYVPAVSVAAGTGSWSLPRPVRAANRPSNQTEVPKMEIDTAVLRKRLGLAEDADDAAITEALAADPAAVTPVEPLVTPATVHVPEGMRLVDAETLATIQQGAEQGIAVAARLAREDRDRFITAAIQDGKFSGQRRPHYEALWESDADGARETINLLAKGLVPSSGREVGRSGDGEGDQPTADAEHEQFMARAFPNLHARSRASGGRVQIRQEA